MKNSKVKRLVKRLNKELKTAGMDGLKFTPSVDEDCCPNCGVAFTRGCNCEPYRKGSNPC